MEKEKKYSPHKVGGQLGGEDKQKLKNFEETFKAIIIQAIVLFGKKDLLKIINLINEKEIIKQVTEMVEKGEK